MLLNMTHPYAFAFTTHFMILLKLDAVGMRCLCQRKRLICSSLFCITLGKLAHCILCLQLFAVTLKHLARMRLSKIVVNH